MDIEFHYYITYIIALRAGFQDDEAYIIAYSSQHVDDNCDVLHISRRTECEYSNYISQTSNILKADKELMQIYPIFHFLPGTNEEIESEAALRKDGKFHILNTIPDNANARVLLKEALHTKNPYRIGIAAHMYADTFAHQNFVGYYESFNAMRGVFDNAIPNVGHADAKHDPDLPGLVWEDARLINKYAEISNKERFLAAAGKIFREFSGALNPARPQQAIARDKIMLVSDLSRAIGDVGDHRKNNNNQEVRIREYKKLIGKKFKDYDERAWLDAAVARSGVLAEVNPWATYEWKPDHEKSHWYLFQEAIKNHQWFTKENILNKITENLVLDRFYN